MSDHHTSHAIGLFAGLMTVAWEGISLPKLLTAFTVAFVAGVGHRLAVIVVGWVQARTRRRDK